MPAVFTVLIVITFSMVVVRIASVALTLTGVSEHLARFQARSAFTGCGFTTQEAEDVVKHPVRRRIIMLLMLFGHAGVATAIASLVLTFVNTDHGTSWWGTWWARLLILVIGILVIMRIAHSRWIDYWMSRVIRHALKRWKLLDIHDYAELFHLKHDYAVSEMKVHARGWLAHHTLSELRLSSEGVLVLGIERADGHYIGAPRGVTRLYPRDTLVLYGRKECLIDLDQRQAGYEGNIHHMLAIDRALEIEEEERRLDRHDSVAVESDSEMRITP